MAEPERLDEEVIEELLGVLRDEEVPEPVDLPDKTLRKVRAAITSRDLVDLTTSVFILQFCAPLLDLIAAFLGQDVSRPENRNDD